jgi:hypothetical protein
MMHRESVEPIEGAPTESASRLNLEGHGRIRETGEQFVHRQPM